MMKYTFIVRVMYDDAGRMVGQLSDPVEGWRRPFATPDQLWQMLSSSGEPDHDDVHPIGGDCLMPDPDLP